jgi:hypothetical protein
VEIMAMASGRAPIYRPMDSQVASASAAANR